MTSVLQLVSERGTLEHFHRQLNVASLKYFEMDISTSTATWLHLWLQSTRCPRVAELAGSSQRITRDDEAGSLESL